jgi:FtsH-binding integral membrane protein
MAYENYELGYPADAAQSVAQSERAAFIRRVYAHLAGAVLALIGLEAILLQVLTKETLVSIFHTAPWSMLGVFVLFMIAGFVARAFARSQTSPALQYLGLSLYVVLQAVILCPLLWICVYLSDPLFGGPDTGIHLIYTAAILTLCVFAGLTISVFVTRKDYSALAPILSIGMLIAIGTIVCGIIFGFNLGLFFCFFVVALMAGFILYQTSNVIHHYPLYAHVAAALELFASIATLFYYILWIVMQVNRR